MWYIDTEVQGSFHGSHYFWWQWLQSVALGFTMLYWELGGESSSRLKIGQSRKRRGVKAETWHYLLQSVANKLHTCISFFSPSYSRSRNGDRQLSRFSFNKRFCDFVIKSNCYSSGINYKRGKRDLRKIAPPSPPHLDSSSYYLLKWQGYSTYRCRGRWVC